MEDSISPGRNVSIETVEDAIEMAVPVEIRKRDLLKDRDRLTVLFNAHLENCCDKAQSHEANFSTLCDSQGIQVYKRKIKITPEWTPLSFGWIPEEGQIKLVVLENICDHLMLKRRIMLDPPDGEEWPHVPSILVSITGDNEPDFSIDPGEFNIYTTPTRSQLWRVKSDGDTFSAEITVFPR